MSHWQQRAVPFKFQLSDWTLFSVSLPLQVRAEKLVDQTAPVAIPQAPADVLAEDSQGFLIRGLRRHR